MKFLQNPVFKKIYFIACLALFVFFAVMVIVSLGELGRAEPVAGGNQTDTDVFSDDTPYEFDDPEQTVNPQTPDIAEPTPTPVTPIVHTPTPTPITTIPIVHITTNTPEGITERYEYIRIIVEVEAPRGSGYSSTDRMGAKARGRGQSTWRPDKKPYRIKFDEEVSIFGLPENRSYVLLANVYDQSFLRNNIAFAIARTLSFDFVPTAVPVELYVNGQHHGLYTLGNSVSIGIDVEEGGFLVEVGGRDTNLYDVSGIDYFHADTLRHIAVKQPTPREDLTNEQFRYIRDYVNAADDAIVNSENYEDYIEMLSLVDYILVMEMTFNLDGSFSRSTFIEKLPGGKLRFPSVWDFDLSMGNHAVDRNRYNTWIGVRTEDTFFTRPTVMNYLSECPAFQYAMRKRWEEVGDDMYNAAVAEIAKYRGLLGPFVEINNQIWPYEKSNYESTNTANIETWEGQLDFLYSFLENRKKWMDEEISTYPADPPGGRDILNPTSPAAQIEIN